MSTTPGLEHDAASVRSRGALLLVLGLLWLCVAVAYQHWLLSPQPLADEGAYVCAAEQVARGASPFAACPRYVHPPLLARVCAYIVEHAGSSWLLGVLRAINSVGVVVAVGLSLELTRLAWRWKLLFGAIALIALPPCRQAIELGNLSGAVSGLTALVLFGAAPAPLGAVLLAFAIALKPLPVLVSVVLAAQGVALWRARPSQARRSLLLGAGALLAALGAFALSGGIGIGNALEVDAQNNVSLTRLLRSIGIARPELGVFVIVALAASWLAVWRARDEQFVKALALVASLLSAPLVWNHSWLLVAPVVALAAVDAPGEPATSWAERARRPVLVALGGVLLLTSDALAAVSFELKAVNAVFVLLPLLTPAALLWSLGQRNAPDRGS